MIVKLTDTVSLEYKSFWNIRIKTGETVDENRKIVDVVYVDNYGNLNRCITALPKYKVPKEVTTALRKAYIDFLREVKTLDTFKFTDKMKWSIDSAISGFPANTVKTNKNHFGVMVTYYTKTEHFKSDKGYTEELSTMPNHHSAAETLLDKTLSDIFSKNVIDLDEFLEGFQEHSGNIVKSLSAAAK